MNTATIVAAAVMGYTWGYHPLDDHATEFLIQMSSADVQAMADGSNEILVDIPVEAGPVRRVRIIVGDERLPRKAPPYKGPDDPRTAHRPAEPAVLIVPDRDTRGRYPREARAHDHGDLSQHDHSGGADPREHGHDVPGRADGSDTRAGVDPITIPDRDNDFKMPEFNRLGNAPDFSRADVGPLVPAIGGRSDGSLGGDAAARVPVEVERDERYGNRYSDQYRRGVLGGDVGPPPVSVPDVIDNPVVEGPRLPLPAFDYRNQRRNQRDDRDLVAVPPGAAVRVEPPLPEANNQDMQRSVMDAVVTRRGPSLGMNVADPEIPVSRFAETHDRAHGAGGAHDHSAEEVSKSPNVSKTDMAAPSPSDEPRTEGPPPTLSSSSLSTNWRNWTLMTGPAAFGLLCLNFYQWGTYKSVRRRYLSLLRRTGEV